MGLFDDDREEDVARNKAQKAAAAERRAASAEKDKEERQKKRDIKRGVRSANQYFEDQGAEGDYDKRIKQAIRAAVRKGQDTDIAGQDVYADLLQAHRNQNVNAFNDFAPTGFTNTAIGTTFDDEIINDLVSGGREDAEGYAKNLSKRGVISDAGLEAALSEIAGQEAGVRASLDEIGSGILESGRVDLANIASEGRNAAGGLNLGQAFDPSSYSSRIDDALASFGTNLRGKFDAVVPDKLFDTSKLASIAGQAQGAGNRAFDPKAVAGIFSSQEEDEEEDNPLQVF